jgi:hypothetical protein
MIADSVSGFSGVQGQNNWYYGYYQAFNTTGFTQLSTFIGGLWFGVESFQTPYLDATGGHPGADSLDWAVRRWESDFSGEVIISGDFYDRDTGGGDGAHVRILQNDTQIFEYLSIPASMTPYSLTTTINYGDTIDLVIDPFFDGVCDSTHFTTAINPVPAPGAFLLGSLGLGLAG